MKISRNKNIITLEIEQSDCGNQDVEMAADFMMAGMLAFLKMPEVKRDELVDKVTGSALPPEVGESLKDARERWELPPG